MLTNIVHRENVRVIERGGRASLLLEATQPIGIRGEGRREDLDGHVAPEAWIARAIHLTHAARPDERQEVVWAKPGARRDGHGVVCVWADYTRDTGSRAIFPPRTPRCAGGQISGNDPNV